MEKAVCIKVKPKDWKIRYDSKKLFFTVGETYEYEFEDGVYWVNYKKRINKKVGHVFCKKSFNLYFENELKYNRKMKLLRLETLNK